MLWTALVGLSVLEAWPTALLNDLNFSLLEVTVGSKCRKIEETKTKREGCIRRCKTDNKIKNSKSVQTVNNKIPSVIKRARKRQLYCESL